MTYFVLSWETFAIADMPYQYCSICGSAILYHGGKDIKLSAQCLKIFAFYFARKNWKVLVGQAMSYMLVGHGMSHHKTTQSTAPLSRLNDNYFNLFFHLFA